MKTKVTQESRVANLFVRLAAFALSGLMAVGFALVAHHFHRLLSEPTFEARTLVGTWQGASAEAPSVTVTVECRGEEINGTVAFQSTTPAPDGSKSAGKLVRAPLRNAKFDGQTLHFTVDDQQSNGSSHELNVEMTLTSENQAELRLIIDQDHVADNQEIRMVRSA